VNSKIWKPTKPAPNTAVMKSQILPHFMSLRWTAASASTISRDDMRRTKALSEVSGMFRIS